MLRFILFFLICVSCDAQILSTIHTSSNKAIPAPSGLTDSEFNAFFDQLNLQAVASQMVLTSTSVDQWTDISPATNNATSTSTARPVFTGNVITFDGTNDVLTLGSEISIAGDFSVYFIISKPNTGNRPAFGSTSISDQMQFNSNMTTTLSFAGQTGGTLAGRPGGLTNTNVFSIRRSGSSYFFKINDRDQLITSNLLTGGVKSLKIGQLARSNAAAFMACGYKAICVASSYISDVNDQKIREYLYSKFSLPSQVFLIGFGDSITDQDTWISNLGQAMNLPVVNLGISGSKLNNVGATAGNGRDRYAAQIISRNYQDRITIVYGTNDLGGITPANFAIQYGQILSGLIAAGYNPRNICISSTPYQTSGANATALDDFRTEIVALAATYNVRYIDMLQIFRDQPSPDALMADALHPNAAGGNLFRDSFLGAFSGLYCFFFRVGKRRSTRLRLPISRNPKFRRVIKDNSYEVS